MEGYSSGEKSLVSKLTEALAEEIEGIAFYKELHSTLVIDSPMAAQVAAILEQEKQHAKTLHDMVGELI